MTISDAVGRTVKCPDNHCGHPVVVRHAQQRVLTKAKVPDPARPGQWIEVDVPQSDQIKTARLWYRCDCPRSGNKMYRAATPVELAE